MKILFDTNVCVSEALLGMAAEEIIAATIKAGWRIFASDYLLDEFERVLTEKLGFSIRFAQLSRRRIARRARLIEAAVSHHAVPLDPRDSPILRAAVSASVDYLVTNDQHLLVLELVDSVRIISMSDYRILLNNEGLLPGSS